MSETTEQFQRHLTHLAPGSEAEGSPEIVLEIAGLSKTFPGTKALDEVDLTLRAGEVHALMGQNGSGKSTLIKVLAGYHQPDAGAHCTVSGSPMTLGDASEAAHAGLRFVHQDLGLVGALSAVENLALGVGFQQGRLFRIRWKEQYRLAEEAMTNVGHQVALNEPIEGMAVSDRAAVAIARALQERGSACRVLVLDEPTAAMPSQEIERFIKAVRSIAGSGTAIIYVSHHIDEVFAVAHRVTVLRDGRSQGTFSSVGLTKSRLVALMTGENTAREVRPPSGRIGTPILKVSNLRGGTVDQLDITVAAGEVVGVAGISGSGREDVGPLIFGQIPRQGEVFVGEDRVPGGSPAGAVALGVGYVPANRHRDGLVLPFSLRENLTLPKLRPFWRRLRLRPAEERAEAEQWVHNLSIKAPTVDTGVEALSGGNQQKVVLGKWLRLSPKVLLLDEPTQGVDVGAKAEIHSRIVQAAAGGAAVLLCSSDEAELSRICTRVLIMRQGRLAAALAGEEISTKSITEGTLSEGKDE